MSIVIFTRNNQGLKIDFDEPDFKFGLCKVIAFNGNQELVVAYDYTDYVMSNFLISLSSPKMLPSNLINNLTLLFDEYCFELWHNEAFVGKDITEKFAVFCGLFFYQTENGFEFECGQLSKQAGDPESTFSEWQNWLNNSFFFFRISLTSADVSSIKSVLESLREKSKYSA